MKFFSVAFCLFLFFSPGFSQTKKGYALLGKKNWPAAWAAFSRDTANEKHSAAAYFGLARVCELASPQSLDTLLAGHVFLQASQKKLGGPRSAGAKSAQKYRVNANSQKNLHDRLRSLGWSCVQKSQSFQDLEQFSKHFPEFLEKKPTESTKKTLRKIIMQTYEKSSDFPTISKIARFFRDYLWSEDITKPVDWSEKLWETYFYSDTLYSLKTFSENHPDHWIHADCWISEAAEAIDGHSVSQMLAFLKTFPYSFIGNFLISWELTHNAHRYPDQIAALTDAERELYTHVVAVEEMDELIRQGVATDTADLALLLKNASGTWRGFLLMKSAIGQYISEKDWSKAEWVIAYAKPLFPNVTPDKCRYTYFRWEQWLAEMDSIFHQPRENIEIKPLYAINTSGEELLPLMSPDRKTFYFTGLDREDGSANEDPYVAPYSNGQFGAPMKISSLSTSKNESIHSITADGQEALIFIDGVMHLTRKSINGWTPPVPVTAITGKFPWTGKATLSSDGQIMIFEAMAQATANGHGANTDLFVAQRNPDGSWQEPVPLPDNINTRFLERSPFLHADNETLYFSSNGHIGLGGMDFFLTRRLDSTWTRWSTPVNLGVEINTAFDDLGYTFSVMSDGKTAFFSRKTPGFVGYHYDIVAVNLPSITRSKAVTFVEIPTISLSGMQVAMKNRNGDVLQTFVVKPGSKSLVVSVPESAGIVTLEPVGDYLFTEPVVIDLEKSNVVVSDTLRAVRIEEASTLRTVFQIPKVQFQTGKSELLPSALEALDKFYRALEKSQPKLTITGHADDQGGAALNQRLSEKRAQAVKQYLVKKGYAEKRITAIGKGSTEPKVANNTDENRAQNRRVEFKISQ